ncbi:armadillo-type protein [Suillus cothurnatus]|nr:armadillo-type protein [Suillus cothurnatus]
MQFEKLTCPDVLVWLSFTSPKHNKSSREVLGDVREVGAGVVAAPAECVRAFGFRQKPNILPNIIATLFPTLVTIADGMLNTFPSQPASQEIPAMLHLIPQTYKTAIKYRQPFPTPAEPRITCSLGKSLAPRCGMAVPVEGVPTSEEDREKCEWWKAKKWAYGILGRLFHRCLWNPSQLPSPMQAEYGVFAEHFVITFTPEIFKMYLYQVELYVSGQAWLGKKCQYQIFQFFTECIKPKLTWILLKPRVDSLVANFAFPQLTFDWRDLLPLPRKQLHKTVLPLDASVHQHCLAISLAPYIVRHPDVKGSIEQFMVQYVLPEFTSQELYLRSVACEVLGVATKAGITWTTEENLNDHSRTVALALDDRELASGTLSLRKLARSCKLSDETDLDILNHSMEAMVGQFQNELLPVASQLTARLLSTFMYIVEGLAQQKDAAPDSIDVESLMTDGDDDKVYGAMGVAKTIGTVVSCIDSSPEILSRVQEVIIPIIRFTLENKLIDALTFRLHLISPNMWPVFELTYDLFKSDAVDFLDDDQLQDIITIAADHIDKGETASFRLANLEILVNAVLYNASAALHFMEAYKPGFSRTFFERWFVAINSNKLPPVGDGGWCDSGGIEEWMAWDSGHGKTIIA